MICARIPSAARTPFAFRAPSAAAARFVSDEGGAMTVDWVVLTAALTGLGLLGIVLFEAPLQRLLGVVQGEISAEDDLAQSVEYTAYDPDAWEGLITDTWETWGDYDDEDEHNGCNGLSVAAGVGGLSLGIGVGTCGGSASEEEGVLNEAEIEAAMNALLTDDQYAVKIGHEDEYAALQMTLEANGGSLPDGWPDWRDF